MKLTSFTQRHSSLLLVILGIMFFAPPTVYGDGSVIAKVNTLIARGEFKAARIEINKAYTVNQSDPSTTFLYAQLLENGTQALELYKRISEDTAYPDSVRDEAYYRLGCAAHLTGKYQKANTYLKKSSPLSDNSKVSEARILNIIRNAPDSSLLALLTQRAADSVSSEGIMVNYYLGLYYFAKKEYNAALRHFAISVSSTGDTSWWGCGANAGSYYCATMLSRSEEAASVLTHIKRLFPVYLEKDMLLKAKQSSQNDKIIAKQQTDTTPNKTSSSQPQKSPIPKESFSIQVGAFGSIDNAEALKTDLAKKLSPVSIISAVIDNKTIFRVRVGTFTTKELAQAFADSVITKKKLSYRIVQD